MTFPRYQKYKETRMESISEIPSEWTTVKVRYLSTIQKGRLPAETSSEPKADSDLPYLTMEYLRANVKNQPPSIYSDRNNNVLAEDGQILVLWDGSNAGEFLKAKKGIVSSTLALIKNENIDQDYLYFGLKAIEKQLKDQTIGMGIPHVSGDILKNFNICVPSQEEQKSIVRFLNHEISKIEDLIAEQEKLTELLREKFHSLVLSSFELSDTLMMRLDHAAEVIQRPVTLKRGEMYEPLGLYNRGRGLFHKEPRAFDEMGDSDFFWIKSGDLIFSGQFAWEGSVAMAYEDEENCVVSHRYPVIRGKSGVAISEYLYALFTTSHGDFLLNECSIGAAGRNRPLNINLLLKEKIPIPNIFTQERIVEMVRQRRSLLLEVSRRRDLLLERKSTLINLAVTGQIDLRNFAPVLEAA